MTAPGYPILDALYPFAGPCAICGGPDKRHRLADAMISNVRGGDPPSLVARDYSGGGLEITEQTVAALVAHADERRRMKKARWPR